MLQACACFIELYNLQVINENKPGGKSSLWDLSECDRKGLRKCDLNGNVTLIIFIILHIMFGPWIEKNGVTE